MHSTITPRRSEHTRRERSAATAAGFAQLRATRLAKLEKKDEIAGATAQQQQKQSEINVENNNDSAGVKAQQQKQQPPKSDSTQRKFLVEVHRGAGRLTLTVKGVKFTEDEKEGGRPPKTASTPGGTPAHPPPPRPVTPKRPIRAPPPRPTRAATPPSQTTRSAPLAKTSSPRSRGKSPAAPPRARP